MVGRNNSVAGGVDFNRESVQSLWREALVLRELARDGVSDARARRSDAELVRRAAEQEALKATEEYCADLRAQAKDDLNTAQESLASAERLKGDIEADLQRRGNDVATTWRQSTTGPGRLVRTLRHTHPVFVRNLKSEHQTSLAMRTIRQQNSKPKLRVNLLESFLSLKPQRNS